MINLNEEFRRMGEDFGLTDKEVFTTVRVMIRSMWSDSEFKKRFLKSKSKVVVNENPRSMKKHPTVTKYQCAICKGWFGTADIELDHVVSENGLKSYDDIEPFMQNIVLTSPSLLQILCKDKWKYKTVTTGGKKRKVKDVLVYQGCHGKKTYSERYDVSLEQAEAEKEAIQLIKQKLDKEWLEGNGITPQSTQEKRRVQIVEYLLNK